MTRSCLQHHRSPASIHTASRKIPTWVKVAYSAFCAVMVPTYLLAYGPTNFIYFCDEAVLLALVGLWIESPLLLSLPAVGILAPQLLWIVDFAGTATGHPITGMTAYMFDPSRPLLLRALSGFHGWLPILLVYGVWRLGYDHRALPIWTAMAVATLLVSFFLLPGPGAASGSTPVNVNYVRGFSDLAAQTLMPGWVWLAAMIVGMPILLFAPTHLLLLRLGGAGTRRREGRAQNGPADENPDASDPECTVHPVDHAPGDGRPAGWNIATSQPSMVA